MAGAALDAVPGAVHRTGAPFSHLPACSRVLEGRVGERGMGRGVPRGFLASFGTP